MQGQGVLDLEIHIKGARFGARSERRDHLPVSPLIQGKDFLRDLIEIRHRARLKRGNFLPDRIEGEIAGPLHIQMGYLGLGHLQKDDPPLAGLLRNLDADTLESLVLKSLFQSRARLFHIVGSPFRPHEGINSFLDLRPSELMIPMTLYSLM